MNYTVMTEISFYVKNQMMDLYDTSITPNHSNIKRWLHYRLKVIFAEIVIDTKCREEK